MAMNNNVVQFGHQRNNLGTAFFVFIIIFKIFYGIGNFVLGLAPDLIMDYFDFGDIDYMDDYSFWVFVALGVLFIAQIAVSFLVLFKPLFFEKNALLKGSPFILTIVLSIFEWIFLYSLVTMAAVSTFSAIVDIFTFVVFAVKPTNALARKLRPFKTLDVKEEEANPRKVIIPV